MADVGARRAGFSLPTLRDDAAAGPDRWQNDRVVSARAALNPSAVHPLGKRSHDAGDRLRVIVISGRIEVLPRPHPVERPLEVDADGERLPGGYDCRMPISTLDRTICGAQQRGVLARIGVSVPVVRLARLVPDLPGSD